MRLETNRIPLSSGGGGGQDKPVKERILAENHNLMLNDSMDEEKEAE